MGGIGGFTSACLLVGLSCGFLFPVLAFVRHRSRPPAPRGPAPPPVVSAPAANPAFRSPARP